MTKLFLLTSLFISLLGCGSGQKNTSGESLSESDEFDRIENADFNEPVQVPYRQSQDLFLSDSNDDSLSKESVAKLPEPKLDSVNNGDVINKALVKCYQGDSLKAFEIFDSVYRKYKKNPSYWNQVGTCYTLDGDNRKGLLYYNKSRDLKKNYAPPINNLGVLYQVEGRDQKALAAYKEANKIAPFSVTPRFNMAQLYLKYGLVEQAEDIFYNLYQKSRRDIDIIAALGTIELMRGNAKRALSWYSKISKNNYSRFDIGTNLSLALLKSGRRNDASSVLSDVVVGNSEEHKRYYQKVSSYISGAK